MVIDNLHILDARVRPAKAHAVLIIHANIVLARAMAPERFQTVSRRDAEVFEPACDFELTKLAPGNGLDVHKPFDPPAFRKSFRVGAFERLDQCGE